MVIDRYLSRALPNLHLIGYFFGQVSPFFHLKLEGRNILPKGPKKEGSLVPLKDRNITIVHWVMKNMARLENEVLDRIS